MRANRHPLRARRSRRAADAPGCSRFAERLRRAVEELCIHHALMPERPVTIGVSVAATMPGTDIDPSHLVEAADAGLYSAKHRGRNCVVVHGAITLAAVT